MSHKLLLADDSVTIQRVIELTFADEDIEVSSVGDGEQAIEAIEAHPPDVVLVDVSLPKRDGYDVTAFVKSKPTLAHIPVVLLTGAFEPVDQARADAAGCAGALAKPFEPQTVINRVKKLLQVEAPADAGRSPAAELALRVARTPGLPSARPQDQRPPAPKEAPAPVDRRPRAVEPPPPAAAARLEPLRPKPAPAEPPREAPARPVAPLPPADELRLETGREDSVLADEGAPIGDAPRVERTGGPSLSLDDYFDQLNAAFEGQHESPAPTLRTPAVTTPPAEELPALAADEVEQILAEAAAGELAGRAAASSAPVADAEAPEAEESATIDDGDEARDEPVAPPASPLQARPTREPRLDPFRTPDLDLPIDLQPAQPPASAPAAEAPLAANGMSVVPRPMPAKARGPQEQEHEAEAAIASAASASAPASAPAPAERGRSRPPERSRRLSPIPTLSSQPIRWTPEIPLVQTDNLDFSDVAGLEQAQAPAESAPARQEPPAPRADQPTPVPRRAVPLPPAAASTRPPVEGPAPAPPRRSEPAPRIEASRVRPAAPAPRKTAADLFADLLAAERGEPLPSVAAEPPAAPPAEVSAPAVAQGPAEVVITEELVEAVARRVLDRLSDRVVRETVTDLVSEITERLVHEEIQKIRADARAR